MSKRSKTPTIKLERAPLRNWEKTNPARQDDPVAHYRRESKAKPAIPMIHPDRIIRAKTATGMPLPTVTLVTKRPEPQVSESSNCTIFGRVTSNPTRGNLIHGRGEKTHAENVAAAEAKHAEAYQNALTREIEPLTETALYARNSNLAKAQEIAPIKFLDRVFPSTKVNAETTPRVVNVVDVKPGVTIHNLPNDADYAVLHTVQDVPQIPTRKQVPNDLIVVVPRGGRNRNVVNVATLDHVSTGKTHSRLVRKETPAETIKRAIHQVYDEVVLNGQGTMNLTGRKR